MEKLKLKKAIVTNYFKTGEEGLMQSVKLHIEAALLQIRKAVHCHIERSLHQQEVETLISYTSLIQEFVHCVDCTWIIC